MNAAIAVSFESSVESSVGRGRRDGATVFENEPLQPGKVDGFDQMLIEACVGGVPTIRVLTETAQGDQQQLLTKWQRADFSRR